MIFDLESTEEVALLYENDDILYSSMSRNGDRLLVNTSTHNPELHVWDTTGRVISGRYHNHSQEKFVNPCAFGGPNEDYILSGSDKGTIFIWHMNVVPLF